MKLKVPAILDADFAPLSVLYREFAKAIGENGQDIVLSVARAEDQISSFPMKVYPDNTGHDEENFYAVERIVKALLWIRGGYEITVSGSELLAKKIADAYCKGGKMEFDALFMERVYEKPFTVKSCALADAPKTRESAHSVGKHLDGCRIGFDAGGSDRKVSAVVDGKDVFSEEVVWFPKTNADPQYHYEGIVSAFKAAAAHMPRVDAIGISSAGIYINNRIMVASLFLKVPDDAFEKSVKNMYLNAAKEIGDVPVVVANDGDVTALAGAMDLNDVNILGCAMGTSQAGGYVDADCNIKGWLNELAFVPVDANPAAMRDEWAGDIGCGVKYFSQDGVIKLAPAAGIELDESLSPADKLKVVQKLMSEGDERAAKIYDTIGVQFGYAVAFYAMFYEIRHVLIMGRVTSGEGGVILLKRAKEVLETEFPALSKTIQLHIPDEKSRRVGQSIAAASLPEIH